MTTTFVAEIMALGLAFKNFLLVQFTNFKVVFVEFSASHFPVTATAYDSTTTLGLTFKNVLCLDFMSRKV